MLAKIRHYVPLKILRQIFFALVQTHVDYAILNWGFSCRTNLDKLVVKLKRCVRLMLFKPRNEASKPLFNELKLFNFENNFHLRLGQFLYKVRTGLVPAHFQNLFQVSSLSSTRQDFFLPFPRTDVKRMSIFFQGLKYWNENIPIKTKCSLTIKEFSQSFSSHLASSQGFSLK